MLSFLDQFTQLFTKCLSGRTVPESVVAPEATPEIAPVEEKSELEKIISAPLDSDTQLIIDTFNMASEIHKDSQVTNAFPADAVWPGNPANFDGLPTADALTSLNTVEFDQLINSIFEQAKSNVEKYKLDQIEQISRDAAIEKEASRLLDVWKQQK